MVNYVVLDLEANNDEIIEIGAIKLDKNLKTIGKFRTFVKPLNQIRLSSFIRDLTKIKQVDIDNAKTFDKVYDKFLNWVGNDSIIITWSNTDKYFLNKEFNRYKITNKDIFKRFLNIQRRVSQILLSNDEVGLKRVLKKLKIEPRGQFHRALDDAINTSRVMVKLFNLLGQFNITKNGYAVLNTEGPTKIDKQRYKNQMNKLTMGELEERISVLNSVMDSEFEKEKIEKKYLFSITSEKYKIIKSIWMEKKKLEILTSQDMDIAQIILFTNNVNRLFTHKNEFILKNNLDEKELLFDKESQKEIKRLKTVAKRYNKIDYLEITKEAVIKNYKAIVSLIHRILMTPSFNVNYKEDLSEILKSTERKLSKLITSRGKVAS
ncbi:gp167 [Bacillus phage G]|uniref:Gp167 n=1 Tax=Bacillus phage G TaxID=2884420 RepID=G3MBN3_9CAUD|nr:gp167 [Bacillus phage G]AEO93427.1 gp167 [Bacillus phage G]